MSPTEDAQLRWKAFQINKLSFDRQMIEATTTYGGTKVEVPRTAWATMQCRVAPHGIAVTFANGKEWVISDKEAEGAWSSSPRQYVGITGLGDEVSVRGLAVRIRR